MRKLIEVCLWLLQWLLWPLTCLVRAVKAWKPFVCPAPTVRRSGQRAASVRAGLTALLLLVLTSTSWIEVRVQFVPRQVLPIVRMISQPAQAQFNPSPYGTVLEHLSAETITGQSDGNSISVWAAAAGVNFTTPQAAGLQPTYKTNRTPSGKPSLLVDGSDRRLYAASNISASTGSYTIFAFAKANNTAQGTGTAANNNWLFDTTTGRFVLYANDSNGGTGAGFYAGSFVHASSTPSGWHVYCWVLDATGGTGTLYIDNTSVASGTYSAQAISGITTLFAASDATVGSATPSSFNGELADLTIYNAAISSANRTNAYNAIVAEYVTVSSGLSAGTISANATTSSSIAPQCTVSGGTAPYSVQFSYSTSSGGTYTNIGSAVSVSTSGGTAVSSAQAGLTASTTYYFKAVVTDSAGTPASVTTPGSGGTALSTAAFYVYNRVDATDPIMGYPLMVLVPNSNAANPYNAANPTRLILYFHGAGEAVDALLTDSNKTATVTALLNAGYILAASTGGGTNNWGNQSSVEGYTGCWKYVTSNYNVSATAEWVQSMGALAGLNSLSENKIANVVGLLGTYPVVSLANLYGLGTYTSAINTAYGITGSGTATYANLTTGHDPALKWGWAFRRVNMRLYHSPSDTVVPKAQNTNALATLVGSSATVTVVVTSGEHGDASNFVPSEYVTFFNNCFTTPPATSGGSSTITKILKTSRQLPRNSRN